MHTPGAQVLKSVHSAAKMCTQGAGCTLLLYGALIRKNGDYLTISLLHCALFSHVGLDLNKDVINHCVSSPMFVSNPHGSANRMVSR